MCKKCSQNLNTKIVKNLESSLAVRLLNWVHRSFVAALTWCFHFFAILTVDRSIHNSMKLKILSGCSSVVVAARVLLCLLCKSSMRARFTFASVFVLGARSLEIAIECRTQTLDGTVLRVRVVGRWNVTLDVVCVVFVYCKFTVAPVYQLKSYRN